MQAVKKPHPDILADFFAQTTYVHSHGVPDCFAGALQMIVQAFLSKLSFSRLLSALLWMQLWV
jgi:hypothetical protein